jgi:endonuclease/exonuclease/phosphatase family metal-dependent hydrolase
MQPPLRISHLTQLILSPLLLFRSAREFIEKNGRLQTRSIDSERGADHARHQADPLKVLTYNIHHGVWTNGRTSLTATRKLASEYDVVCLNEASRNQARAIAAPLGFHWISSDVSEEGDDPYSNNAILSRFPIEESRLHLLPYFYMIPWRRRILQATLNVHGSALNVLAAHLSLLPGERGAHLRCAAEIFDDLRGPRVLCGDFNVTPNHPEVERFAMSYQDSWAEKGVGPGLTFGTRVPFRRLDYIFSSSHFEVQEAVMPDTLQPDGSYPSDHHPVAATLSIS